MKTNYNVTMIFPHGGKARFRMNQHPLTSLREVGDFIGRLPKSQARFTLTVQPFVSRASNRGCAFRGATEITCPKCLSDSPFHQLDSRGAI